MKKEIRSLAWVVVKWAAEVRPRVIILENVREFEDWGPLIQKVVDGKPQILADGSPVLIPDPNRKGHSFKRWAGRLRNLGYAVQWRVLNAADYGAPTHRRRLFLVARCDGVPIAWPEPTHGDPKKLDQFPLFGRPEPWRTAALCIDWSIPCPSIFDRKRPLADKTMRRIAMGLQRYVLENARPYIVPVTHALERSCHPMDEPLPSVTGRGELALASPFLARIGQVGGNGKYTNSLEEPATTITSKAEHLIVAPTLIQTGYGEREGQAPRAPGLDKPLGTCVNGQKHALVAAMLTKFRGESRGSGADEPMPTVTSGAGATRPAGAAHALGIVTGTLVGCGGPARAGEPRPIDTPLLTVMPRDSRGLAAVCLARFNHGDKQWNGVDEPLGTATSQGNKFGLVYAFLTKYFGTATGQQLREPLHTATAKHRFGLVFVEVSPGKLEPAVGLDVPEVGPCIIADIGLRMLSPRELARAQGFPDSYVLTGNKSNQVAKIGNSVPPVMAQVLCAANYRRANVRLKRRERGA